MDFENARPVIGRTPPHSVEAEEYLLSCALIDGIEVITVCLGLRISATYFFVQRNRVVFEKLLEMYGANKPMDLAVLVEELKASGQLETAGGIAYLTQISGHVPTAAQGRYFAEKIRELHLRRQLLQALGSGIEACYETAVGADEFIDKIESDIFSITQERVGDGPKIARHAIDEAAKAIDFMITNKGVLTGLSSGFYDLDKYLYGFQRQNLIILSARTSMGKTSLALNFAENVVLPKRGNPAPVLIFSLEMSAKELGIRLLTSRARVNSKLLREGLISKNGQEQERVAKAKKELLAAPLFIDDSPGLTIMEVRAKARRLHQRQNLGLIIVDYLGLVHAMDKKQAMEAQIAEVSSGLKALAKELDVPVIALAQLNRESEKEARAPRLSDIRGSGAIEQDADVVLFLARPKDADEAFQTAADTANLIVAKQRNGAVGEFKLTFLREITRFENWTA